MKIKKLEPGKTYVSDGSDGLKYKIAENKDLCYYNASHEKWMTDLNTYNIIRKLDFTEILQYVTFKEALAHMEAGEIANDGFFYWKLDIEKNAFKRNHKYQIGWFYVPMTYALIVSDKWILK